MALTDCCGLKIVFYMISKPQSNRSGLYANNVTLRSNRSLTTAAYILTMVTLRKPLRFESQRSV